MRDGHPSQTSNLVTFMRALAHGGLTEVHDFADATALPMLPPAWRLPGKVLVSCLEQRPHIRDRMLARVAGHMDLVALRTKVLDAAWQQAHTAGTRQLVLLGAGLDGRAYRLDTLNDSTVYEVDHPATQELKRQRAEALISPAQRHVYIPVDFRRDRLADAIAHAGHRQDQPTCWIWEGVTTYLQRAAQEATLAAVAKRSCAGSTVAMTYVEPSVDARGMRATALLVRAFGEPFVGFMSREQAAQLVAQAGMRVREDSGLTQWRARYARPSGTPDRIGERILVAEVSK